MERLISSIKGHALKVSLMVALLLALGSPVAGSSAFAQGITTTTDTVDVPVTTVQQDTDDDNDFPWGLLGLLGLAGLLGLRPHRHEVERVDRVATTR